MAISVVGSEVKEMFGSIAGRYDITNTVLSFGIHHYWRQRLVRLLPKSRDLLVMDLCTGTADLLPLLESRFGRVVGADFCRPMLEKGREKLGSSGHARIPLLQSDAMNLPMTTASFDIISVAFGVRNFENLRQGLSEMRRVLKKDGHVLILEFGQPRGLLWGGMFRLYSNHIMPFIGGLITGNREAYTYLPRTAGNFPCGADFAAILNSCGFRTEKTLSLTGGIAYAYLARAV